MNFDYICNLNLPTDEYVSALQDWFMKQTKKYLNIENPTTFNEKIQWLKLYDSTPLKAQTTDKYLVRDWVKKKIGEEYLIPLLGVYNSFDEIDFDSLPNKFVIKTNHSSCWNCVVTNKKNINIDELRAKFNLWLNTNFAFMFGFELHYKDIKPKIIIEKFIQNKSGILYDYKFWCFNGEPKYIQFRDDWKADLKMAFFDTEWNKQEFHYDHPLYEKDLPKPDNLSEMLDIAKKLCKGFMFVCVDLYRLDNGKIYFGEMTYTRSSGIANWQPEEWNKKLGEMIKLPKNKEEIMKKCNYKITYEPKISVIIPVYNVEKYLPRCLDSVINQTLKDIEIICINDESPDKCNQILTEYAKQDKRIIVLNQKNSGQGSARNRGLEVAKGKYIQFLDSDDFYQPNCCEEMYNIMEKYSDVDVACFDTNIIYESFEDKKEEDASYFKMNFSGIQKTKPSMIRKLDCNCWNKIFRKSFIDEYGLRFPEKLHFEDVAFYWFWLSKSKKIYFYNKKLTNYIRRKGSFLGEIYTKSSTHIFEMFHVYELIYTDLIKNKKFDNYKEMFLQQYLNNFRWLRNCFSHNVTQEKRKLIDKCSVFLQTCDINHLELSSSDKKCFDNIISKNYYYFDAYNNHEIEEAFPVFPKDSINIVFSTDNNYIPYLAVAISSIIENSSPENNYDIIILYQAVYEYQKRFILSMVEKHQNISIRFFDMTQYIKNFGLDKLCTLNHITLSAYFRLFVGQIFTEYKKILYLDCDLIVTTDIAQLYHLDIGNYPIAAALDTTISHSLVVGGLNTNAWTAFRKYMSETLNFTSQTKYFNSGVMIIDIEKFNEMDLDYLIDLAQRNNKFFHDQNVLNAAFEGNYFELSPTWNFQWNIKFHSTDYKYVLSPDLLAFYEDPSIQANIVHYTSHEKPWKNPHHTFANIWWEYARKTPFYEIFLKDLNCNKMVASASDINKSLLLQILSYKKDKRRYYRYKILSKITFGNMRKYYKQKRKELKAYLKNIERIMRNEQS